MKTKIILATVSLFIIQHSVFGQGALTPPGAPVPTMKSLAQIEPRTPISSAPFTISASGSYYLTTNLTTTVSNAIVITANGVTLDLSGFTLNSTVASAANGGAAIFLNGGVSDITVFNGHIHSGVTNNGSNIYGGAGFGYGIYFSPYPVPLNVHVSGVSVSGCLYHGIYLFSGDSTLVEGCTVRTMGGYGIVADTIKNCVAKDCGSSAIVGDQIADSRGESTGSYGISCNSTAQNCYGSSSGGTGLIAVSANNCYGTGTAYGLYAFYTASGCTGICNTGTGLYALIANVCHGVTVSGTALSTPHNVNSF